MKLFQIVYDAEQIPLNVDLFGGRQDGSITVLVYKHVLCVHRAMILRILSCGAFFLLKLGALSPKFPRVLVE
jgi:hypothetical protein